MYNQKNENKVVQNQVIKATKMMRYFIAFSAIVLCFSCRKIEKIEMAGNIKPKLIVNCLVTEGEPLVIYVNKSLSALDNASMKPVTNALVKVFKNGVLLDTAKYDNSLKFYFADAELGATGANYTLEVSAPGLGSVKAAAFVPETVQITSTNLTILDKMVDSSKWQTGWEYYGRFKTGKLRVNFQDQPGKKNYYMLVLKPKWSGNMGAYYSYGTWSTDRSGTEKIEYYDNEIRAYYFFNDMLDDGKVISMEFKTDTEYNNFMSSGDSLLSYEVLLYSLTEDYSRHLYSLYLSIQNDGNPFEEPVQIFSNVENGYGVFGGQSSTQKEVPFPY